MEDFDSSLLPKSGYLPTQGDRQVDEFDSPGISSGGGVSVVYPFDVISAGTSAFTVTSGRSRRGAKAAREAGRYRQDTAPWTNLPLSTGSSAAGRRRHPLHPH